MWNKNLFIVDPGFKDNKGFWSFDPCQINGDRKQIRELQIETKISSKVGSSTSLFFWTYKYNIQSLR
jgi:hypothetical protein